MSRPGTANDRVQSEDPWATATTFTPARPSAPKAEATKAGTELIFLPTTVTSESVGSIRK